MARTPIIAGNWKMNTLRDEALALREALRERLDAIAGVEKIVCPPFVYLHDVRARRSRVDASRSARRTSTGRRRARSPAR